MKTRNECREKGSKDKESRCRRFKGTKGLAIDWHKIKLNAIHWNSISIRLNQLKDRQSTNLYWLQFPRKIGNNNYKFYRKSGFHHIIVSMRQANIVSARNFKGHHRLPSNRRAIEAQLNLRKTATHRNYLSDPVFVPAASVNEFAPKKTASMSEWRSTEHVPGNTANAQRRISARATAHARIHIYTYAKAAYDL